MATASSIVIAKEFSATQGINVTSATTNPVLWLRYKGTTDSGASLAIDATTGDLAATTDGTTADSQWLESDGTAGNIDVSDANADTWGEVLDIINGTTNWEAVLWGDIRTGTSTNCLTTLAETDLSTAAYKSTGLWLYGDSAVTPYVAGSAIGGFDALTWQKGYNPEANCYSVITYIDVTADITSAGNIKVYTASQTGQTLLWTNAVADDTNETHGNMVTPLFRSRLGERLIVMVDSDKTPLGNSGWVRANGYTVDTSGSRFVNGINLS